MELGLLASSRQSTGKGAEHGKLPCHSLPFGVVVVVVVSVSQSPTATLALLVSSILGEHLTWCADGTGI